MQAKAYTTRVGAGPYPTELFGKAADTLREVGREYGTTTGRPRRVGWLDIPALKYATRYICLYSDFALSCTHAMLWMTAYTCHTVVAMVLADGFVVLGLSLQLSLVTAYLRLCLQNQSCHATCVSSVPVMLSVA